ncbi:MAG: hypothetical protein KIPDCIKN_03886 [Haliscomenobacter sp.]|nr:hypothetical protein [Haliscomenobacter sp.]
MKNKPKRILIAGYEIGGQMQLLAETIRNRGFEATAVAFNEDFRGFSNDIQIKGNNAFDRLLFSLWAWRHFDVFHFFWGVSLLEIWRFHQLDLPLLKITGKKIFPHFRGLDVVDIRYFDYLRAKNEGKVSEPPPMSRTDQLKRLSKWIRYADRLLVSEPDLHQVVPDALLSPQVIDLHYWQTKEPPLSVQDGIVRVAHAPTSRRKKGTEYLERAITNLQAKGLKVELLLAEKLQAQNIKGFYEQADIGVDQLLYGWHGKVSCELMAMQKPVICYIDPAYGKYRPDLPIVSATPQTIEQELEKLILSKSLRMELGNKGLEFVRQYHDVEKVVDELIELYGFEESSRRHNTIVEDAKTW